MVLCRDSLPTLCSSALRCYQRFHPLLGILPGLQTHACNPVRVMHEDDSCGSDVSLRPSNVIRLVTNCLAWSSVDLKACRRASSLPVSNSARPRRKPPRTPRPLPHPLRCQTSPCEP